MQWSKWQKKKKSFHLLKGFIIWNQFETCYLCNSTDIKIKTSHEKHGHPAKFSVQFSRARASKILCWLFLCMYSTQLTVNIDIQTACVAVTPTRASKNCLVSSLKPRLQFGPKAWPGTHWAVSTQRTSNDPFPMGSVWSGLPVCFSVAYFWSVGGIKGAFRPGANDHN